MAHHGASLQGDFEGDPLWNGRSAHDQVREFRAAGTLPDLEELLENGGFREFDDMITYPVAGSFVRYLLDQRGIESFKAFARVSRLGDNATKIESDFEAAYGETVRFWWDSWLVYLAAGAARHTSKH